MGEPKPMKRDRDSILQDIKDVLKVLFIAFTLGGTLIMVVFLGLENAVCP